LIVRVASIVYLERTWLKSEERSIPGDEKIVSTRLPVGSGVAALCGSSTLGWLVKPQITGDAR
jgi:hypothetical protein